VNDATGPTAEQQAIWPQTKSDTLLREVTGEAKTKTVWKKIQGKNKGENSLILLFAVTVCHSDHIERGG